MSKNKGAVDTAVDTIEKLAELVVEGFADVDERFEKIDERFEKIDQRFNKVDERFNKAEDHIVRLELAVKGGFVEMKTLLERIDTRIAALEMTIFGASHSDGQRLTETALLARVAELEKVVFKK